MPDHLEKASQSKAAKQDGYIMGTNNSSIVSKRSVERLYYPDEPHFFRYFVKKPQRRAPLINRGYWLRMKAIDHVVRQFLEEPSEKRKIVMNLGCGYDPNPWQCLSRYSEACKNVTFIDIDYMALMQKKREVVRSTAELIDMLTNVIFPESGNLVLQSDQYLQVGCDLRELSELSAVLASAVDIEKCLILCTAEVSITYMNVEAADALVKWVSHLPDSRFCLLEQILPNGPEHPFAKTMLAHFEKLNTPLRAAGKYPTVADQELRFRNSGWKNVQALNLWQLWGVSDFLTSAQRMALDEIEPFDEWEEFALFACHYCLLVASNEVYRNRPVGATFSQAQPESLHSENMTAHVAYAEYQKSHGYRRFGAPLPVRALSRKRDLIGDFGGMGLKSRLSSYDTYAPSPSVDQLFHKFPSFEMPSARMCHTITDFKDPGALLVGGRSSPDKGLSDCWIYHKWSNAWERVDDLPKPRYRHSSVVIGAGSVLVAGGKSDSRTILKDFSLWSRRYGWVDCVTNIVVEETSEFRSREFGSHGDEEPAIFGGMLCVTETSSLCAQTVTGILAGGIAQDGLISENLWIWTLHGYNGSGPSINIRKVRADHSVARFGATMVSHSGRFLVVGGVTRDVMLTADEEIVILHISENRAEKERILSNKIHLKERFPTPLFIGCTISCSGNTMVITGGGAVCFSFGTFWNRGCFTLNFQIIFRHGDSESNDLQSQILEAWRYMKTVESNPLGKSAKSSSGPSILTGEKAHDLVNIQRMKISSAEDFSAIVLRAQPVILEQLNLGSCTAAWTSNYLQDHIGRDRKVVVHQASDEHMDFMSKNFQYVTKPFGEFMEAVDAGKRLYLRSLSAEKPSELPADLDRDFPTISNDFQLPPELKLVGDKAHSSALRIAGPVNMWLHYDVMANILCQIRGRKRLLLFPPSDVQHFHFLPGASSSSTDVFTMLNNDIGLTRTQPHEGILWPGDVLFIPALWLHTASPVDGASVAVNVFFRDLESGYAVGKDVYGNRDLQAYEKGRQDVARIAKSFSNLPKDARLFYLLRLGEELKNMADS